MFTGRYTDIGKMREKVEGDVKLVSERARVVFYIDEEGSVINLHKNENWSINVIAIIGPGEDNRRNFFEKAILFELGIGPTRPYHDTRISGEWLHKRRKWFFLSERQYLAIRLLILSLMKEISMEKLTKRKNLTWTIKNQTIFMSRSRKRSSIRNGKKDSLTGVRFSVSKEDDYFLSEIYNLELFHNPVISSKLDGMARFIDLSLQGRKNGKYSAWKYSPKEMEKMAKSKSSGVKAVADSIKISNLLAHHYWHIISLNKVKKEELFLRIVGYVLDIGNKELKSKINRAGKTLKLLSTENNFGLMVRTIPERKKKRDVVVFEVAIPELVEERRKSGQGNCI